MKLAARTLRKAIQDFNAAGDPDKRSQVAVRWFERNATVTLEEIIKILKENDR